MASFNVRRSANDHNTDSANSLAQSVIVNTKEVPFLNTVLGLKLTEDISHVQELLRKEQDTAKRKDLEISNLEARRDVLKENPPRNNEHLGSDDLKQYTVEEEAGLVHMLLLPSTTTVFQLMASLPKTIGSVWQISSKDSAGNFLKRGEALGERTQLMAHAITIHTIYDLINNVEPRFHEFGDPDDRIVDLGAEQFDKYLHLQLLRDSLEKYFFDLKETDGEILDRSEKEDITIGSLPVFEAQDAELKAIEQALKTREVNKCTRTALIRSLTAQEEELRAKFSQEEEMYTVDAEDEVLKLMLPPCATVRDLKDNLPNKPGFTWQIRQKNGQQSLDDEASLGKDTKFTADRKPVFRMLNDYEKQDVSEDFKHKFVDSATKEMLIQSRTLFIHAGDVIKLRGCILENQVRFSADDIDKLSIQMLPPPALERLGEVMALSQLPTQVLETLDFSVFGDNRTILDKIKAHPLALAAMATYFKFSKRQIYRLSLRWHTNGADAKDVRHLYDEDRVFASSFWILLSLEEP